MRCNGILGGQSGMILLEAKAVIVQSTISMHSMLMLGGLGACPPEK